MTLKILILSPMISATGNTSTVQRLQSHFVKQSIDCAVLSSLDFLENNFVCPLKKINEHILQSQANFMLIVHAFKSGSCIICQCTNSCKLCVKYGVIFGGTDLNEDVKDDSKVTVMQLCVQNASFGVVFNEALYKIASDLFPSMQLHQHAQAIDYELYDSLKQCSELKLFSSNVMKPIVFLLPCSIRPVKDPLYVVEKIQEIRLKSKRDVRLLILGPVTDQSYGQTFFDKVCSITNQTDKLEKTAFFTIPYSFPMLFDQKSTTCNNLEKWLKDSNASGIQYMPAIAQKEMFRLLKQRWFSAVLNTSLSEGMSSILLEAMAIGVPVIARNIPGNCAIISNNKTGLLFSSPDEFADQVIKMLGDTKLLNKLASCAYSYVIHNHNPYLEANFYVSLCEKVID